MRQMTVVNLYWDYVLSFVRHIIMLHLLSQSVWVQDCGVVKCCGGLAGDRRQQPVGKRPGASPHSPQ